MVVIKNTEGRYTAMNNKLILAVSSAMIVIFLVGCGGSYRASHMRNTALEEEEHIIYRNVTLKASVAVMDHSMEQIGDLMKVKARFKNTMGKQINAEIKVKFLDQSGYEIADNWGWQPFPLEKGEIKEFERIAPTKTAVDYRIFIQLASTND